MKGNNGTGNIEKRNDWETPKILFEILNKQYTFQFDCCASNTNNKCPFFTNDFINQVKPKTELTCWMNPPFSKAEEMFKHFFKVVKKGVSIYRCDNLETALWQDIIFKNATWILIPRGRISYEGKAGKGSRFPSALIGFNVDMPKNIEGTKLIISSL